MKLLPAGVYAKQFVTDLNKEMSDDNVWNGAAALAYYLTLAIFPATLFLLSLLPYLPVPNLDKAIMDLLNQALPGEAAKMFTTTVQEIALNKKGGLLSFGLLATIWAAANGTYAIIQQLNITYDVKEGRKFFKLRGTAIALTVGLGLLMVAALGLVVAGGAIQGWLAGAVGSSGALLAFFAALRWVIIAGALLTAFALLYNFGPDTKQKFRFLTPGSVLGTLLLAAACLALRGYVANFGNYDATYGSIGAMIVLMLWLYVTGLVILLGSEVNSLFEHWAKRPAAR